MYLAIRQTEFALLQLVHHLNDLFAAIQCAIQGNLSVKLVDPLTLRDNLRNVILHLPDVSELIVDTD
jgi:hypothetical protein